MNLQDVLELVFVEEYDDLVVLFGVIYVSFMF